MEKRPVGDGPSMEQYVETRLNLLTVYIDRMEHTLLDRIEALDRASLARYAGVRQEVEHARELLQLAQDNSKRAVDKSEATQAAHNVAANEWRGTLNDFKSTLINRSEFERLSNEFSAYRLEVSRLLAASSGEKSATREGKETSLTQLSLVSGAIAIIASVAVAFMLRAQPNSVQTQAPQEPRVIVVPSTPPQAAPR